MITTLVKNFKTKVKIITRLKCTLPGIKACDKVKPLFYVTVAPRKNVKKFNALCESHDTRASQYFKKQGYGNLLKHSETTISVEDYA